MAEGLFDEVQKRSARTSVRSFAKLRPSARKIVILQAFFDRSWDRKKREAVVPSVLRLASQ
jgi:hypothetical protein